MFARPLIAISAGLALAALDFRVVSLDLLPDTLGWLLVGFGAWRLSLTLPAVLAGVAALASIPDMFLRSHYDAIDPLTGEVVKTPGPGTAYHEVLAFDRLSGVRTALVVTALLAGAAALWSLLGTLRVRAHLTGDDVAAGRLSRLRALVLGLWALPFVTVLAFQSTFGEGADPVWNGGLELVALVGMAVALATALMLALSHNRGWTATDDQRPTPWQDMLAKRR